VVAEPPLPEAPNNLRRQPQKQKGPAHRRAFFV
jgi:hypothetical protein